MRFANWLLGSALVTLLAPFPCAPQAPTDTPSVSSLRRSEYEAWIRPYRTAPRNFRSGDKPDETILVISEIWGDEKKIDDNGSPFRIDHGGRYVCWVWSDGRASFSTHDRMGGKGGDIYPGIQETDLRKLTELLAHLPDDFSSLPPPGRRLVLQVWAADGPVARVYDRANAPDSIVEILRLSRSSVRSWVQTFEPLDQWRAHEDSIDGALAALPGGSQVVSATVNGPLRLWFRDSHVMEKRCQSRPFRQQTARGIPCLSRA